MPSIKLLTLNLHCLEEKNILLNQSKIINEIIKKNIDVIFLQEVAQYIDSEIVYGNVKKSNYGYVLQQQLKEQGKDYFYYFADIKYSFGKYNEGVAILSKYILHDVKSNYISKTQEYAFWRTRKMIKGNLHLPGKVISLVSSHLGWTDKYEVFEDQLDRMISHLDKEHLLFIAGDFNVSPTTKEYKALLNKGLFDLYGSHPKHLLDPTHIKDIDLHKDASRIDYIFSNSNLEVLNRDILFKKDRVSDHYGVFLEIKI